MTNNLTQLIELYRGWAAGEYEKSFFSSHMTLAVDPNRQSISNSNPMKPSDVGLIMKNLLENELGTCDEFTLSRVKSSISIILSRKGLDELLLKICNYVDEDTFKQRRNELDTILTLEELTLDEFITNSKTLNLEEINNLSESYCRQIVSKFKSNIGTASPKYNIIKDPPNLRGSNFSMFVRKIENEASDVYYNTSLLTNLREGSLKHFLAHEVCGHAINFSIMHQNLLASKEAIFRAMIIPYSEDLFYVEFIAQLAAYICCTLEANSPKKMEIEHRIYNLEQAARAFAVKKFILGEFDHNSSISFLKRNLIQRSDEYILKIFKSMISDKESCLVSLIYAASYNLISKISSMSGHKLSKIFLESSRRALCINEIEELIRVHQIN